jgi:hypothetical protein
MAASMPSEPANVSLAVLAPVYPKAQLSAPCQVSGLTAMHLCVRNGVGAGAWSLIKAKTNPDALGAPGAIVDQDGNDVGPRKMCEMLAHKTGWLTIGGKVMNHKGARSEALTVWRQAFKFIGLGSGVFKFIGNSDGGASARA